MSTVFQVEESRHTTMKVMQEVCGRSRMRSPESKPHSPCLHGAISFCVSMEDCWRTSPSCFVSPRRGLINFNSSCKFLWEVFSLPPAQRANQTEQGSYPPFLTEAECMQEISRHPSSMRATTHIDWLLCLLDSLLCCVPSSLTLPLILVPTVASAALGGRHATYRQD